MNLIAEIILIHFVDIHTHLHTYIHTDRHSRPSGNNIMQFHIALYPQTTSTRFAYYSPGTPYSYTCPTPQRSILPGYTLPVATCDQSTVHV